MRTPAVQTQGQLPHLSETLPDLVHPIEVHDLDIVLK